MKRVIPLLTLCILPLILLADRPGDKIHHLPSLPNNTSLPDMYSGYFDIGSGKHYFYWLFESSGSVQNDPIVLWLNGGLYFIGILIL